MRRKPKLKDVAKDFYMLMMFLWIARTSPLTSFNFGNNPVFMPVYLLIILLYYIYFCKKSYKPLIYIIYGFVIWYSAICFKYGMLVKPPMQPIYYLIISHVALNLYSLDEFLRRFNKILVFFCSMSLIVWVMVNLIPELIVPIMHSISLIDYQPPTETYSILFGIGSSFEGDLRRNIGFTWEPGVFSCYVLLGIFFVLIQNRFKITPVRRHIDFYILVLTLLTTLSTTGYSVFLLILLFMAYNVSTKAKWISVLLGILIIPAIASLSFMLDKIVSLTDIERDLQLIVASTDNVLTPQRFSGLYLSLMNFINDAWLGYCDVANSYSVTDIFRGIIVTPSEGVIAVLAKYGIILGGLLYLCLFKSSVSLSQEFHYKGRYFFAVLFLCISISYDFWENCILMYIYLYPFYKNCSKSYNRLLVNRN
jgi:hypothetical protein